LAGSEIHERQFPLGAIFISLGLLIYGAGHSRNKESMFSRCGAKYSLGIYLLHPFILTFTFEIFRRLGVIYSLPNLLIAFLDL
jgi:peptidoglycan/LPS O-acetylase OafA/YrhL